MKIHKTPLIGFAVAVLCLIASSCISYHHSDASMFNNRTCRYGGIQVVIYPSPYYNQVTVSMPGTRNYDDPIGDGDYLNCRDDVRSNHRDLAAVRHGRYRDSHRLYGQRRDGGIEVLKVQILDGRRHTTTFVGGAYHIRYGGNHDLTRIYEFINDRWEMTRER